MQFFAYFFFFEFTMYILALDLSLSDTGGCIFDINGNPIELFSIPTDKKNKFSLRLKTIGDYLLYIKDKYDINLLVLERGFSRFNKSTQTLFAVHGVVNYLFYNLEQIYYAPSTIKKMVAGNGRADKKDVEIEVLKRWPDLIFSNNDESDACAVGLCYFLDQKLLK